MWYDQLIIKADEKLKKTLIKNNLLKVEKVC